MQPTGTQRIIKIRRDYNAWVADETMEDYALRFTPRSFRKWSELRIANTALGAVSFLALEAIGGPLALVRNGDRITLDVAARTIDLDVPEAELVKRRAEWKQPEKRFERGYGWMFSKHIKQANEGCDFDFMSAKGK